ncbi:MAG TPA: GTP-binding protein, partial [Rhodocyclaceae bacterium]|nr:GTP-binding protein [Rhodocyclaceae bacterium]
ILSVTEGEDKPLKYPDMFAAADLMLLNKIDLLPYLSFDVARAIDYARRVNPRLEVICCSATSGEGMAEWLAWIARGREAVRERASAPAVRVAETPDGGADAGRTVVVSGAPGGGSSPLPSATTGEHSRADATRRD